MARLRITGTRKLIGLTVLLISLFVLSRFLPFGKWVEQFTDWIKHQGILGFVVFAAVYVLGTAAFFPGSLLTIASGIAFGLFSGTVVASLSSTVGASLAFLIARQLARGTIAKRAEGNEKFKAMDAAIGREGWKLVLLLRLSPVVPFNLSNYLFGLTKIDFWPYVWASCIGMFPGTLLYVYLGHIGKAALASGHRERSPQEYVYLALGLVATLTATAFLTQMAKRAIKTNQDCRQQEPAS